MEVYAAATGLPWQNSGDLGRFINGFYEWFDLNI